MSISAPSSSSSSGEQKQIRLETRRLPHPNSILASSELLTCGVGELLLSDLLQLEDLLQSLRDLGPADAHLLALPHLEQKQKNLQINM